MYTVPVGNGSVIGLDAAKRCETTALVLGSESVSVHAGEVNLLGISWRLDGNTESLAYADDAVVVSLTDGSRRTHPSDDRPAAALAALDDRHANAEST